MKDTELRCRRDKALYDVYVRGIRTMNFKDMVEATDWCRTQPAPQFFISVKSLVNYIGDIMKGRTLDSLHPNHKEMVEELIRRYKVFMAENPNCKMSREAICEMLIMNEAPQFYIGTVRAYQIIQKHRKLAKSRRFYL